MNDLPDNAELFLWFYDPSDILTLTGKNCECVGLQGL